MFALVVVVCVCFFGCFCFFFLLVVPWMEFAIGVLFLVGCVEFALWFYISNDSDQKLSGWN